MAEIKHVIFSSSDIPKNDEQIAIKKIVEGSFDIFHDALNEHHKNINILQTIAGALLSIEMNILKFIPESHREILSICLEQQRSSGFTNKNIIKKQE